MLLILPPFFHLMVMAHLLGVDFQWNTGEGEEGEAVVEDKEGLVTELSMLAPYYIMEGFNVLLATGAMSRQDSRGKLKC